MQDNRAIVIGGMGRLGNQMFKYMFAQELVSRAGGNIPIYGADMPEWGIQSAPTPDISASQAAPAVRMALQSFDVDAIACLLRQGLISTVHLHGWAMRIEYYREPQHYAGLFVRDDVPFQQVADDEILLHVRAGDTMRGMIVPYMPMPMSWYAAVIGASGLRPVFIGELDHTPYVRLLRERFPHAKFLPPASRLSDFQTLRHARHVALSISSFGWLAAWLSQRAETIHMPVCGLFRPTAQFANLAPAGDPRYRFYDVPFPDTETRKTMDFMPWLAAQHPVTAMARAVVAGLLRDALLNREVSPVRVLPVRELVN